MKRIRDAITQGLEYVVNFLNTITEAQWAGFWLVAAITTLLSGASNLAVILMVIFHEGAVIRHCIEENVGELHGKG